MKIHKIILAMLIILCFKTVSLAQYVGYIECELPSDLEITKVTLIINKINSEYEIKKGIITQSQGHYNKVIFPYNIPYGSPATLLVENIPGDLLFFIDASYMMIHVNNLELQKSEIIGTKLSKRWVEANEKFKVAQEKDMDDHPLAPWDSTN